MRQVACRNVRRLGYNQARAIPLLTCAAGVLALAGIHSQLSAAPVHASFWAAPLDSSKPFTIQNQNSNSNYWLVTPAGERFFSFGVCCVDTGASRTSYNETNPGYAAWQHYSDSRIWAGATLDHLKSWGFTTIGGWSEFDTLKKTRGAVAFTPVLHIGSTVGFPWLDMWDAKHLQRLDDLARERIVPLRDDPRVLGYYSDNEVGWWNASLFRLALKQSASSGQRQRLMRILRETYHTNWSELRRDFEPEDANDWQELSARGTLHLRPGGEGIATVRQFVGVVADRYYSLMRKTIRKYDPRGLYLGDRYQSFYFPEVARASGKHVDISSSNLNASWNDGSFPRFYLATLHALTGKPVIIGEFYMAAHENRSGNRNNSGVFPVVQTQRERARSAIKTLKLLMQTPYVVGADWFQYYDEPTHGRGDGENFNFGLVDIQNRPYEELTRAFASFNPTRAKNKSRRSEARRAVPEAPRTPFASFEPTLALRQWDREGGFVQPITDSPIADLYVSWTKQAVHLGLYAQDVTEPEFYRDERIPETDRSTWHISTEGGKPEIVAVIGAGMEPRVNQHLKIVNLSGVNLNARNIAALELPAKYFGKPALWRGDRIRIRSTFLAHCRSYRTEWDETLVLK